MKEQIVSIAEVYELAIIAGERFEARVSGFDEDVGLVAGAAKTRWIPSTSWPIASPYPSVASTW